MHVIELKLEELYCKVSGKKYLQISRVDSACLVKSHKSLDLTGLTQHCIHRMKAVNYFHEKIYLRCFTGCWIPLCSGCLNLLTWCLDYDCDYKKGTGYAVSEQIINKINTLEPCIAACHEMKTIHPTTNGLTIHQGGCTCEQGLFQHNGADNFRSCSLKEKVRNETGRSKYVRYN